MIARKILLFVTALNIMGCGKQLPEFPEVWQCAHSEKFNKFRCVNTRTKKAINVRRDDPIMEGAQCLSVEDYKSSEAWVAAVKEIAESQCRKLFQQQMTGETGWR